MQTDRLNEHIDITIIYYTAQLLKSVIYPSLSLGFFDNILALPVFDGLTHFNPFSFLSSVPTVF